MSLPFSCSLRGTCKWLFPIHSWSDSVKQSERVHEKGLLFSKLLAPGWPHLHADPVLNTKSNCHPRTDSKKRVCDLSTSTPKWGGISQHPKCSSAILTKTSLTPHPPKSLVLVHNTPSCGNPLSSGPHVGLHWWCSQRLFNISGTVRLLAPLFSLHPA